MSFGDATQTFTLLTVGDGLVSQMPALIVSTAAGLMVSKAGVEGATDKALMSQLSFYPQALGMAAAVMGVVAVLPGMPTIVFGALVRRRPARSPGTPTSARTRAPPQADGRGRQAPTAAPKEEPISTALALDLLRVELGYGLLPLINDVQGHRITDQIKALRRQLAQEMGFVMPAVRILDNMQLGANEYRIRVKEVDSGKGELFPGSFLIMDPKGLPIDLPGTHTTEPAFGLPATWVSGGAARGSQLPRLHRGRSRHGADHASDRSAQEPYGRAALLCRDQEAAGRSAAGEQEAGRRTDPVADFRHRRAARAADPAAASASRSATCRPSWKASPKRSATPRTRSTSPSMCAPGWRASSAMPICRPAAICRWSRCRRPGSRPSPNPSSARARNASSPWRRRSCSNSSRRCASASTKPASKNEVPVLLTSPQIRPFVRSIIERFRPQTVVMSQNEIHASVRLRTLGQV